MTIIFAKNNPDTVLSISFTYSPGGTIAPETAYVIPGVISLINTNQLIINELKAMAKENVTLILTPLSGTGQTYLDQSEIIEKIDSSRYGLVVNSTQQPADRSNKIASFDGFIGTLAHETIHALEQNTSGGHTGASFESIDAVTNIFTTPSSEFSNAINIIKFNAGSEAEAYTAQAIVLSQLGLPIGLDVVDDPAASYLVQSSLSNSQFQELASEFTKSPANLRNSAIFSLGTINIPFGNEQQTSDVADAISTVINSVQGYGKTYSNDIINLIDRSPFITNDEEIQLKIAGLGGISYKVTFDGTLDNSMIANVVSDLSTRLPNSRGNVLLVPGSGSGTSTEPDNNFSMDNYIALAPELHNDTQNCNLLGTDLGVELPSYSVGSDPEGNYWHVSTSYVVGDDILTEIQDASYIPGGVLSSNGSQIQTFVSGPLHSGVFTFSENANWSQTVDDRWSIDIAQVSSEHISDAYVTGQRVLLGLVGSSALGIVEESSLQGRLGLVGFTQKQVQDALSSQQDGILIQDKGPTFPLVIGDQMQITNGSTIYTIDFFGMSRITGANVEIVAPGAYGEADILTQVVDPGPPVSPTTPQVLTADPTQANAGGQTYLAFYVEDDGSSEAFTSPGEVSDISIGSGNTITVTAVNDKANIDLSRQTSASTGTLTLAGNDTVTAGAGQNIITVQSGANVIITQGSGELTEFVEPGGNSNYSASPGAGTLNIVDSSGGAYSFLGRTSPMTFTEASSNSFTIFNLGCDCVITFGNATGEVDPDGTPQATSQVIYGGSQGNSLLNDYGPGTLLFVGGSGFGYAMGRYGLSTNIMYAGTGTISLAADGDGDQLYAGGSHAQSLWATGSWNDAQEGNGSDPTNSPQILSAELSSGEVTMYGGINTEFLIAGSGNDSFLLRTAGVTYGTMPVWADGYGNTPFIATTGHTGVDTLVFINHSAGGNYTIEGFAPDDMVVLSGYGPDAIQNAIATLTTEIDSHIPTQIDSVVTLSDGSVLTFEGVSSIDQSSFEDDSTPLPTNELVGDTTSSTDESGNQTITGSSANGFAQTVAGTSNTIDFSGALATTGEADIVVSAGDDTITGGHGNLNVTTTGNANITTQADGNATLALGGGQNTVLSNGTDSINGTSGTDTVTARSTSIDSINGTSESGTYTLSGQDSLQSNGTDTVSVLGGISRITASGASVAVNLTAGEAILQENAAGGAGYADVSGGTATLNAGQNTEMMVSLTGPASTAILGQGDVQVDATVAPQASIIGGSGSAEITTAIGGTTTINLAAEAGGSTDLVTSQGNDTITGGSGTLDLTTTEASNITTGSGSATVTLGAGGNTVVSQGSDTIMASAAGNDTISASGTATILGGGGSNTFTLSGTDMLTSVGADTIDVSGGNSTATISGSSLAVSLSGGSLTLDDTVTGAGATLSGDQASIARDADGTGLDYTLNGMDTLAVATGDMHVTTGVGSTSAITLDGATDTVASAGTDTITGGSGDDTVSASGNSTITGGSGTNAYMLSGTDVLAAEGTDTADVTTGSSTITGTGTSLLVDVAAGASADVTDTAGPAAGEATVDGMATIMGGSTTQGITVTTQADSDTVTAGAGTVLVIATGQNESITAGSGTTVITANGEDDTITGGSGTLALDASHSTGGDVITTQTGAVSNITLGTGTDTVQSSGTDTIMLGSDSSLVLVDTADSPGMASLDLSGVTNVPRIVLEGYSDQDILADVASFAAAIPTGHVVMGNTTLEFAPGSLLPSDVAFASDATGTVELLSLPQESTDDTTVTGTTGLNSILPATSTTTTIQGGGSDDIVVGSQSISVTTTAGMSSLVDLSQEASGSTDTILSQGSDTILGGAGAATIVAGANGLAFTPGDGGNTTLESNAGTSIDIIDFDYGIGTSVISLDGVTPVIAVGEDIDPSSVMLQSDAAGDLTLALMNDPDDKVTFTNDLFRAYYGLGTLVSQFDYAGSAPTYIGGAITFTYQGTATQTTLTGSDWGSSVFVLGAGGDQVTVGNASQGGTAYNIVDFDEGDGNATVDMTGGYGVVSLGPDIADNDVLFEQGPGNSLVIALADDPADTLTLDNDLTRIYNGAYSQMTAVQFADGTTMAIGPSINFTEVGTATNMVLVGSGYGSNTIVLGEGGDTVTAGNGSQGGSTYNVIDFDKGDGHATVDMTGAYGVVDIAADIDPSDVIFQAGVDNSLTIALKDDPADSVTLENDLFRTYDGAYSAIGSLQFADGSTLAIGPSLQFTWQASATNTVLVGSGWGGNTFYAAPGGDIITDGNGSQGGSIYNTVVYDKGDGNVTISSAGAWTTLSLGTDIQASDLVFTSDNATGALTVSFKGDGTDSVTVASDLFPGWYGIGSSLDEVDFADGTSMQVGLHGYGEGAPITFTETASATDTSLTGSDYGATTYLLAPGGGDTVTTGTPVNGAANTNNVIYDKGDGNAVINITPGSLATLELGADISQGDVLLQGDGTANDLVVRFRGDTTDSITFKSDLFQAWWGTISCMATINFDGTGTSLSVGQPSPGVGGPLQFDYVETPANAVPSDTFLVGSDLASNTFELAPQAAGVDTYVQAGNASEGGSGANTVDFGPGDGTVTANMNGGTGTIVAGAGITQADIDLTTTNDGDLIVGDGQGDYLHLDNDISDNWWGYSSQADEISFSDGSTMLLGQPSYGVGTPLAFTEVASPTVTDLVGSLYGANRFVLAPGGDTVVTGNASLGGSFQNEVDYSKGDGNAVVHVVDSLANLCLGAGILQSDVMVQGDASNDLVVRFKGDPTDSITFTGILVNEPWGVLSQMRSITFADGTQLQTGQYFYGEGAPLDFTWQGTSTNTVLVGSGWGGNTFLLGAGGDTVTGGNGSLGGSNQNTYVFSRGDGTAVVNPNGGVSTVQMSAGITQADVQVTTDASSDLVASVGNVDSIILSAGLASSSTSMTFSDGTTWNSAQLSALAGETTTSGSTITGGTGEDILQARSTGDTLVGGGGSDVYLVGAGSDMTTLVNASTTNSSPAGTLVMGTGDDAQHLWLQQSGTDLLLQVLGTNQVTDIKNWFSSDATAQLSQVVGGDGLKLDGASVSSLVSTMGAYSAANPGFSASTATAMPEDPTLRSAISSLWHT